MRNAHLLTTYLVPHYHIDVSKSWLIITYYNDRHPAAQLRPLGLRRNGVISPDAQWLGHVRAQVYLPPVEVTASRGGMSSP